MALRSGLAVYLYVGQTLNGTFQTQASSEVSDYVQSLEFTTLAPGGWGTLSARINLRALKVARPQFTAFARIAVMEGRITRFLGELMTPEYTLDAQYGDCITIAALGLGNGLRDNAGNWTYTSSTAQAIAQAQLNYHTGGTKNDLTAVLSTDNTQLFPDNPSLAISQVYVARTMEEILADVAFLAGDYSWGVEADPTQTDFAGFPKARVYARARTLTSVDFQASAQGGDIYALRLAPSAERAYNVVEIDYLNGTSGLGTKTATDTRLNSDLSQGTAPFRYRRYARDLSSTSTVTAAMAQQIANTYLALYQNLVYTGTATLRGARDGSGRVIPLWRVSAGANLFLPEFGVQGAQLPTSPTQNVNLFYLTQTTYREDNAGNQQLDVQMGFLPDTAGIQIARLQMAADAKARSGNTVATVQAPGAAMTGYYGWSFSNALSGAGVGAAVTFPAVAANVPTNLNFSAISVSNLGTITANNFTSVGCNVFAVTSAAGGGYAQGTYKTVGNCLRHVNAETGRFAHHCDGCDAVHTDRSLADALFVSRHFAVECVPGSVGLSVACPTPGCGMVEAYNTGLSAEDERETKFALAHRAEQARLIRQAMGAIGLSMR